MPPDKQHTALATQVGGHPGILTDRSGRTVVKPLLPVELAFYQLLAADDCRSGASLGPLRGLTPRFKGVLELPVEGGAHKETFGDAAANGVVDIVEGNKQVADGEPAGAATSLPSTKVRPSHPSLLDTWPNSLTPS